MKTFSVLLALDGSEQCTNAMDLCFALSKDASVEVTAQHVADTLGLWEFLAFDTPGLLGSGPYIAAHEAMKRELRSIGETLADVYLTLAQSQNVPGTCVIDEGNIIREVYARAQEHDLVVMGHRRTRLRSPSEERRKFARRSNAERLVHYLNRPFLVVQDPTPLWKSISLVLSADRLFANSASGCLEIAKMLKLPLNVYFWVQSEDEEKRLPHLMSNLKKALGEVKAATINFRIVQASTSEWVPEVEASQDTLMVIPTVEPEKKRESAFGTPADLVLRNSKRSALLFWPEEFSLAKRSQAKVSEAHLDSSLR